MPAIELRIGNAPFLLPAVSVIAGMAISSSGVAGNSVPTWALISLVLALATVCFQNTSSTGITALCALITFGVAAGTWYQVRVLMVPPDHLATAPPAGDVAVVGTIASFPEAGRNGGRVDVDVAGIETDQGLLHRRRGRVRISLGEDAWSALVHQPIVPGDGIRCETELIRPVGYLNPGCFEPARQLRNNGIYLSGSVRYAEFFTRLNSSRSLLGFVAGIRRKAGQILDRIPDVPSPSVSNPVSDVSSVSKALLLGSRGEIGPETQSAFQESGLVHLLAISGLHVGVIAGFVAWLLKRFPGGIRSRSAILVVLIGSYAVFTGSNPSVVRSACIVCIYMIAGICYRPVSMKNILSLSAIVLLIWQPGWIGDPGFQLTYAATAGIALLYPGLRIFFSRIPGRWIRESVAVALAAQCATAPISAVWFNRIGILGAVTGLPLIPLTSLVLICGLAALLLNPVPFLGPFLLTSHGFLIRLLMDGARMEADIPWVTVPVMTPSATITVLSIIAIGILSYRDGKGFRSVFACVVIPLVMIFSPFHRTFQTGEMHLWMLDVGNGDCSLVRFPDGRYLMIDAGGIFDSEFDIGEKVVVRAIRTLGVRKIDTIVITHPHPDHQLGMKAVIESMKPAEMWVMEDSFEQEDFQRLVEQALDAGVHVRAVERRGVFRSFPLNENNRSIVLGIRYGRFRILLPGDAEKEVEAGLLDYGSTLKSTILKVGHHGSRTSSSPVFIKAVSPAAATIPCGRKNQFDHPHESVLRDLKCIRPDLKLLRSDYHGMVHVCTDGFRVRIDWMTDEPCH